MEMVIIMASSHAGSTTHSNFLLELPRWERFFLGSLFLLDVGAGKGLGL